MWYGFIFIIGLLMLIISLFLLKERIRFLRNGAVTIGTVIELEQGKNSDGDNTYKPIFKFTTHANQQITFKYNFSTNPPSWSVGDTARIVYDNNSPENAKLLTYFGSFGLIVILTSIALPLMAIGGGYYMAQHFFKLL